MPNIDDLEYEQCRLLNLIRDQIFSDDADAAEIFHLARQLRNNDRIIDALLDDYA